MTDIYLHGIETVEQTVGPRPVQTVDTGIIGLIGTAPDAIAANWPLNTPVAVFGINGNVTGLGDTGTLPDAIEQIFAQAGRVSQTVVVIRVEEGDDIAETMSNIVGDITARTGVHAFRNAPGELNLRPKILIAPGFTEARPTDGIASIAVSDGGEGYTSVPTVTITGDGAGAKATAVINSETGVVSEIVLDNPGAGYSSATVTLTGGGASEQATATATVGTVANPVTVELLAIAPVFRAIVVKEGVSTSSAAAVTDRLDYDTDRLFPVTPMVKVFQNAVPMNLANSSSVAGLMARVDYEEGFWVSPSNHVIQGIVGTSRVIEHSISDPSAESQYLNKNSVACIVRAPSGGFKLWGSRVASSDTLKKFLSVRRSHDTIIDSIELASEPFIDKPFSLQVLVDIAETVNAALRRWEALGATLGGRVWLDPTLNTKETWANGHLYVSYDAEGPAPIEHITFMFNRNTGYYEQLAESAVREINRIAGSVVI